MQNTVLRSMSQQRTAMSSVKVLLQYGAEVEAADADGVTAFTYAVRHGRLAAVRFLYEHDACAIAADRKG